MNFKRFVHRGNRYYHRNIRRDFSKRRYGKEGRFFPVQLSLSLMILLVFFTASKIETQGMQKFCSAFKKAISKQESVQSIKSTVEKEGGFTQYFNDLFSEEDNDEKESFHEDLQNDNEQYDPPNEKLSWKDLYEGKEEALKAVTEPTP